ncbi:MAG: DNA recombination protein RmuC [Firmicutes bacterium]|nr:DNA recombination protein RmuC [Bacillota bacterium]
MNGIDGNVLLIILAAAMFVLLIMLLMALNAIASLRREQGAARRGIDDVRRDIEEARRDIDQSAAGVEALRSDTSQSLQLGFSGVSKALSDNSMLLDKRMEYLRSSVEQQLVSAREENAQQLEKMRYTVDEKLQQTLDDRLSKSFESVRLSLDSVYQGLGEMQTLASGVGDLKKVLSGVKTRGILGEIQLGAILSQMLSPEQYDENVATRPGSSERVEFAVKMPGEGSGFVYLPIDAKFPADRYEQLLSAYENGSKDDIIEARKALAAIIRAEAKDISTKYIEPPYTTDFAVLFLPFEGLYSEVVNLGLMEELQRTRRVMIAGPSTMSALLNSLQMGFRTLAIQKNAGEVWKVLGSVKSEFDKFEEALIQTQQRLDQANSELDKLVGTRTRAIKRRLSAVQELGGFDTEGAEGPDA